MGFTPFMVEAMMNETRMDPMRWRQVYSGIILDPLALSNPTGKQLLPGAMDRKSFRESVAMRAPIAPRKIDTMKAQDVAAILEGIKDGQSQ